MFNLFLLMVVLSVVCFAGVATLWAVWGIPDILDELTGAKRKRQIEKLKNASRSIGASEEFIASATLAMRVKDEDDEVEEILKNAHTGKTREVPDSSPTEDNVSFGGSIARNIRIISELSNVEV